MKSEKIERIDIEIKKYENRLKELQSKIETLQERRQEAENLLIINAVRKANVSVDDIIAAVKQIKKPDFSTASYDEQIVGKQQFSNNDKSNNSTNTNSTEIGKDKII